MKYNKNNIIEEIAAETGFTQREVKLIINLFIEKIKQAMLSGQKVLLKGFITFSVRVAKPRKINDFKVEGNRLRVDKRTLPKAKFSDSFVQKVKKMK
jgi:nucleoid DNA-binding protein